MRQNSKEASDLIKRYKAGENLRELEHMFDLREGSIPRMMRRWGVDRNSGWKNEEQKKIAIQLYKEGYKSASIAEKFGVSTNSVLRVVEKNGPEAIQHRNYLQLVNNYAPIKQSIINMVDIEKYGTTYIHDWRGHMLTANKLEQFTDEQKQECAKELAPFYVKNGFPYPLRSDDELIADFASLKNLDCSNMEQEDKSVRCYERAGLKLFHHFAPHFYDVKNYDGRRPSFIEAFNSEAIIEKLLLNRLMQNYNMTGNMLRQGLSSSKLAFKPSIFFPSLAKFIYSKYCKENDVIYDYSMGFGQRMLAALSLPFKVKYVATDPLEKSVNGNRQIFEFLNKVSTLNKEIDLNYQGSENFFKEEYRNKIDLAFSSPPYFNLEIYEDNANQAFNKINNSYNSFINIWWKNTVENIDKMLKSEGYFILNMKEKVHKFNIAEDMINVMKAKGYNLIDIHYIKLTRNTTYMRKANGKTDHKFEPIFIMQRVAK